MPQQKNLAILGASYLQLPLIEKARAMGYTTHVFAWAAGDVGEAAADHFYPISITEKDAILDACRQIGVCGVCTIASDLAAVTVNYVAHGLGLPGNSPAASLRASNKHAMRQAFAAGGDPSPRSLRVENAAGAAKAAAALTWPVIVKPADRSGSRGITKLTDPADTAALAAAVDAALAQGFAPYALVEEFACGQEYSVECISCEGRHHFLAMTQKYTTGAPHFIETGHLQPAPVSPELLARVQQVTFHALDTLGITDSASHTELKIDANGRIALIEIGGRMGGDYIGSHLVPLSTGVDFVRAVIDVAVGRAPDLHPAHAPAAAAVRYILTAADLAARDALGRAHPDWLVHSEYAGTLAGAVTDSAARHGCFVMAAPCAADLAPWLPAPARE